MQAADEREPLSPDLWRRIGAVLDRLSDTNLDVQPGATEEACRTEGVPREIVEPFLATQRRLDDFPEQVEAAVLHQALQAHALSGSTTAATLEPGTRLGAYEIVALLGTGGMGDVYKARDIRLGRNVALKVLKRELAERPDARQRFEREARAISSLNHPHICTLHDVGEHDLLPAGFLVMELVEGETLAARLQRGPLPVDQALEYAVQIADTLAAAHRHGIVHRDLKPANIMLTAHGVKLLDFGLAALRPGSESVRGYDQSLTTEATILGTLHYMAPEQIQGKPTDERTDIFALGAMVHEMLTRRKAFEADNPASVFAALLDREPPPVSVERNDAPAALDRVIGRCLAKSPEARWQSAADLASELRWLRDAPAVSARAPTASRTRFPARAWVGPSIGLAIFAAGLGAYSFAYRERTPSPAYRFAVPPPEGTIYTRLFALSPDGRRLVFTVTDAAGVNALWLRPLDALVSQRIEGTQGANYPFWSPDGRSVGFFADRKLKTVDVASGVVRVLCNAGLGGGGTWNADGVIVFAPESAVAGPSALMRVSAIGGEPQPVTRLAQGVQGIHTWPQFLPDGHHYLYTRIELTNGVPFQSEPSSGVYVGSLDGDEVKKLLPRPRAIYADGDVFYVRGGQLVAQPFALTRLELTGEPVPIAENVEQTAPGRAAYDASANGVLAYRTGRPRANDLVQLTWFDRDRRQIGHLGEPGRYASAVLSPDSHYVLADGAAKVLRIDVSNGTATPLPETGVTAPVWSPDGSKVAFTGAGQTPGPTSVGVRAVDGSGGRETILPIGQPIGQVYPNDWSTDGQFIVGTVIRANSGYDLFATRIGSGTATFPVASVFDETDPDLSPDMKWIAYAVTDESRHWDVYVRPFEPSGGVWRVSRAGGRHPRWSGDGRELYYVTPDGELMAASISGSPSFRVTDIRELFQHAALGQDFNTSFAYSPYDVGRNGDRFLVRVPAESGMPEPIQVLLNWRSLGRR
jgi:Tol biopolymer transport system component/tRNA A-37 threonylcarbamoyl transferase component Bud32